MNNTKKPCDNVSARQGNDMMTRGGVSTVNTKKGKIPIRRDR